MALPTVNFDPLKTIFTRKTFLAFKALQADGISWATTATELIGKALDMDVTVEEVMREVPDADGYMRPDRIEVVKMSNIFKWETDDVKTVSTLFGGLQGGSVSGKVVLFVVDPKDVATKVAVKSSEFKCFLKMDGSLSFKQGEFSKVTLTVTALEKPVLTIDATA